MADKHILHVLTPVKHVSPFDVNMALDAGFDAALPYTNVELEEVTGLVRDAMYSRPPKTGVKTGVFFGGKNAITALDMLSIAQEAFVPPFGVSLFTDPAGSFTTAAAMIACVEKVLREKRRQSLKGLKVAVFGATGVVGFAASVVAALEGASVTVVGHDGVKRVTQNARAIKSRFGVDVQAADGSTETRKAEILSQAQVALCAGPAGVRILSSAQLARAGNLLLVADVNGVPPSGVEGLDLMANGVELTPRGTLGIGSLAIGNIKYKNEFGLFQKMIGATKPASFDFRAAFEFARELIE
jgi:methylene-tetrahydromethanopterin dehydrogenase